ncbi:YbaK/EbsC family protein [Gaiella sp.]|uniref:aminoacyl-tRNA deacylase n=1 Tax=Gaiella sp. TaxID=2663207 RepID=UPI00326369C4
MAWPDPVERVAVFLRAAGAEARLEEFESATPSAQAAADAIGCALEQIVKSLVFVCGTEPVLALLPGDRRADPAKIALVAEASDARVARPAEVIEVTGFVPGGVSPVPPPPDTLVLIEQTIISSPVVWIGGGSDRHMAMLSPHELVRLSGGSLVDIAQESA